MKKRKMGMSLEMTLSLMWFFVCIVLHSAPPAQGLTYTTTPDNATVNMGKSTTFTCAISPGNTTIDFTAKFPQNTFTLKCPGNSIDYPSMSLYGRCEQGNDYLKASWQMSNIGNDVNNSRFICSAEGLTDQTAYLWISGASAYFLMLFGCVIGGFFGILIVFIVAYIALKKSEKLQECYKGKEEEDVFAGVQEETF